MVVPKARFDELIGAHRELGARLRAEAEERLRANRELAAEA